jgi:hypothetical protein
MGPTRRVDQRRPSAGPGVGGYWLRQGILAAKGVGLDDAAKEGQMIARSLTPAIGAKTVIGGGGSPALPWSLVNH